MAGGIPTPPATDGTDAAIMSTRIQQALAAAVTRLLRPLVRVLLRNGVPFGAFADLAKSVYVEVAGEEFGVAGRPQTNSRIAVITGLSRKEVLRVQRLPAPEDRATVERYNRAARVISGWTRDPEFSGPDGRPAPLPLEGNGASFFRLVRNYSGDVPPRAILDELTRVGAARLDADDHVHLLTNAYIPNTGEIDKIGILGTDVATLIATIDHNLRNAAPGPRYQRKVAYDNLPAEVLPKFRVLSAQRAQALLEELDRFLAQYDRDLHPNTEGGGRKSAGFGIYYFEEDMDASGPEEKPHARTRRKPRAG
jgi:hypothetical protein